MRIFARLIQYAARYRVRLGVAVLLSLINVAVELARPWPVKIVVDYVLTGRSLGPSLVPLVGLLPGSATPSGLLIWCIVATLAIVIGGAALSLAVLRIGITLCQRLVNDLLVDLFEKLQRLSLAYHGRHPVGDLLQRVSGDVLVVFYAVTQVALPILTSLLTLGGMFFLLMRLDTTLALIALSVVPLLIASLVIFMRPIEATTRLQYEHQGALMALVEQSLSAIKAIQGFAREEYVQNKVEKQARELGHAASTAMLISAGSDKANTVITGVASAILLGLGASRVMSGSLSVGDLLVFLGYLSALYGPVSAFASAIGYGIAVITRSRRVFEVLDCEEEVRERPDPVTLGRARGEIRFDAVTFGYQESESGREPSPVLEGMTFHARPGQITAIVGATGAGKSSLVSLLSRFYDPWEGRIAIDGHDLRDLSLKSLRENVALVLQDPFLFPMSVADNIAFGRPDATRAEIVEAARLAHAHAFIERLPQGYDTVIAEKGGSMSGGERQRIAIARALLKDAPILILDEPTSALDAHTESRIFEALSELMRGKTTFIISHRLSTIRRADQIIALENGRIAERGTHESLLASDGVYANLYRHQHIAAL